MVQTPSVAPAGSQTERGTVGLAGECGSSTRSKASENGLDNKRLVMFVLRNTVMFACGTLTAGSVGRPPVQLRTRSPTSSVRPSARTVGGTPAFATHWNAPMGAPLVPPPTITFDAFGEPSRPSQ